MAASFKSEPEGSGRLTLVLTAVFAVLFVVGGIAWLYHANVKRRAELDSAVESMVRDMAASGWSRESIERHASPGLKEWMDKNNLADGIPDFRELGPVKEYKGIQDFRPNLPTEPDGETVLALVGFWGGDAGISLHLVQGEGGQWLIYKINLDASKVAEDKDK